MLVPPDLLAQATIRHFQLPCDKPSCTEDLIDHWKDHIEILDDEMDPDDPVENLLKTWYRGCIYRIIYSLRRDGHKTYGTLACMDVQNKCPRG